MMCLYSSVLHHLTSLGISNVSVCELRQIVADHFVSNRDHYVDFLVGEHVPSITDQSIGKQLFFDDFDDFVRGVRSNTFLCIRALCEIFNITVNLLHVRTNTPGGQPMESTLTLSPRNTYSINEIDNAISFCCFRKSFTQYP